MTETSTEARELALVENVEFRFALADTDSKLQTLLDKFLAPLLLKLGSEHAAVRNKVIGSCQHINTRVKPQTIRLPVAALIKQFKDSPNSSLIRHFDLLYAQQGITRLTQTEQAELLPSLISGISSMNASAAQGSIMFHFLLQSLIQYRLPPKGSPEGDGLRTTFGADDDDVAFLSRWFGKLLLMKSPNAPSTDSRANPGLGSRDLAFLTMEGRPDAWTPIKAGGLSLTEAKVKVLGLLSTGLFAEAERLFPALLASSDSNSRVSDTGEDLLKHAIVSTNFDDRELIEQLFDIYFGTKASETAAFVPAVGVRLRTRILGLLLRAKSSSEYTQNIIRFVEEDLLQDYTVAGEGSKTDRELTRLRSAIITFLTISARRSSKEDLDNLSRPIIQSLKLFIEQESQQSRSSEIRQVRGDSFEIIGLLAAANPKLAVEPELELLKWLFQCLGDEADSEMLVSIDQALSSTLRCFLGAYAVEVQTALRALLLRNVKSEYRNKRNVRYASLRFANRCLPFQDVTARWVDIFILSQSEDATHEAIEEAEIGLDPYRYNLSHSFDNQASDGATSLSFPAFQDLVDYIFWSEEITSRAEVTVPALSFCRQALMWNALRAQSRPLSPTTDWDRRLDVAVSEDLEARSALRNEFANLVEQERSRNALVTLFNEAVRAFTSDRINVVKRQQTGLLLTEFCVLLPESTLTTLAPKFSAFENMLGSNDYDCRAAAIQAYVLLATRLPDQRQDLAQSLDRLASPFSEIGHAVGSKVHQASGALQAIAGLVSRRLYLDREDRVAKQSLETILPTAVGVIKQSTDSTLLAGAFAALGQLCLFQSITTDQLSIHIELPKLFEIISGRAQAGDEKAVASLGHISLILQENSDDLKTVVDHIYKLHEIKQAESQFAVGEALACAACGWQSSALLSKFDLNGPVPQGFPRKETFDLMLERVISNTGQTKPSLKKASVLWLLCFVQFCGERPEIQGHLRKLQAIFKRCLSDRDELIQESASRGLGLIYEKGNRELKDDLVRDLIGSFSSDRADTSMSGTITDDTQLFEEGFLPTGEGQSVSTYKDIMNLASEVGDSSLVYRFMNLASSDALWSSRAAFGKFGLSSVLSESSIDGYLSNNPKLYPKLFRYRFDPTTKVRISMNVIWNALVKDTNATVNAHFALIMEDLLTNILGKEWRTRQSCCSALADLVQGQELPKINPYLERLWTLCSKVLDDIKQSVRTAAASLSRVLTGIVVRTLEADTADSASANKMLESVIPFLFSPSGLDSSSDDVKATSIVTLLDIVKKAKAKTLRPFVPDLVDNLLGLLTSLEHQAINYLYLNAAKYNLEESDIDSKRLQAVRSSPLMEAIERCIDALDEDSMAKLASRLQLSMKSAVGTPSKVGCALVLISLSTRKTFLFKPHADTLLNAIPKHMNDRNETVSQSYAAALGYVARGASDASIVKVAAIARRLYFEADDERARLNSAEVVRAIAKYSTDRFSALGTEFLPFVFFARHDDDEDVKKLFDEVWDGNTGGSRAASLYLKDIVQLVNDNLKSARWSIKHAAALAVSDTIKALASTQGNITTENALLLWTPLKQALLEKTWEGKEKLLEGLETFVEKAPMADLGIDPEVRKLLTREANRRNLAYQGHAIGCLAKIASFPNAIDLHEEALSVVDAAITEHDLADAKGGSDRMDVDPGSGKRVDAASAAEGKLRCSAVDAVLKSIKLDHSNGGKVLRDLSQSLDRVELLSGSSHSASLIQLSLAADIQKLADDLASQSTPLDALRKEATTERRWFDRLVMLLFQHDPPSESARLVRSRAATALARLASKMNQTAGSILRSKLESSLQAERSSAVAESLNAAIRLLT